MSESGGLGMLPKTMSGVLKPAAPAISVAAPAVAAGAKSIIGSVIPWVGPALSVATLVPNLIGRGRKRADIWVNSVQNPVNARLKEIVDSVNADRTAGKLTRERAQQAIDIFDAQIKDIETSGKEFEALGGKQKDVIAQWRAGDQPTYTSWRTGLESTLESFPAEKEPDPVPDEAPTRQTVIGQAGTKRKPAPRRSTIIGGSYGEGRQARKTLLGS